jgi:hypothetical protein
VHGRTRRFAAAVVIYVLLVLHSALFLFYGAEADNLGSGQGCMCWG